MQSAGDLWCSVQQMEGGKDQVAIMAMLVPKHHTLTQTSLWEQEPTTWHNAHHAVKTSLTHNGPEMRHQQHNT